MCASFVPLTYIFGVETSGRTLEQIDEMFFDNPRAFMGLDKKNTVVVQASKEDEENRYRAFAKLDNEKMMEVEHVETAST